MQISSGENPEANSEGITIGSVFSLKELFVAIAILIMIISIAYAIFEWYIFSSGRIELSGYIHVHANPLFCAHSKIFDLGLLCPGS
jgi:hypothetical protein